MNPALAAWAWPLSAALSLGAWQVWPRGQSRLAGFSLFLALLSAWASQPLAALGLAAMALLVAVRLEERLAWMGAVGLPLLLSALLRARYSYLPVLPEAMSFWAGMLGLVAVCIASQGLLVNEDPKALPKALIAGQSAWCFFALVTGSPQSPIAFVGLLGLLWQQWLLRVPLEAALRRDPPPSVAVALLFLGLGGCLGLSGFSAYFQLFIPLMGQGDGVATMTAKLFSGAGLLAAVAMLAVLVQTCAFGYFYWLQVLPRAQEAGASLPWRQRAWPWVALGLSLAWGLNHYAVSGLAIRALQAISPLSVLP